ncbi:hypothetical protein NA66_1002445 [Burkholderia pyrrocinia]|uniref:Uncharacterized protein n=1 Tax=Burkholderia pyrrocinia TaxID=60550 RepID=A0A318J5X3_BURPY|nr:hypothetical protein NA66_1002445 [Burkholderia pyrrocinia]SFW19117.1 hypothetical protein SAMN03159384_00512 [Burkholderia sp. NFACC33-1]SFX15591.1 hypothetical protein SAMN03159408_00513 [Burkholderia sp. NFPP32]
MRIEKFYCVRNRLAIEFDIRVEYQMITATNPIQRQIMPATKSYIAMLTNIIPRNAAGFVFITDISQRR